MLSAEDTATYERMESEIDDLTKALDRHRKAEQREKELESAGEPAADWKTLFRRSGGSQRQDVLLMSTAGPC